MNIFVASIDSEDFGRGIETIPDNAPYPYGYGHLIRDEAWTVKAFVSRQEAEIWLSRNSQGSRV